MGDEASYHDRSVLIHGKFRSEKWDFSDHILPPITTSVAFRLESAERGAEGFRQFANPAFDRDRIHPIHIYERLDDPNQGLLEETLAYAEKGETAVTFATGMAAISAAICAHVRTGDHVVLHHTLYGCTYSLVANWLTRFGVSYTLADLTDLSTLHVALRPETAVVYFETPCNPTMEMIDIHGVAKVVEEANAGRERKIATVVDNTFATPFAQRPLTLGVDMVVDSLTKHLGGFGADMGGVVVCSRDMEHDVLMFRKDFGGSISPKSAWQIMAYGVPTLALRLEKQQQIAQQVAEFLEGHPKVAMVRYPGLESYPQKELAHRQLVDIDGRFAPGSLIYFEVKGRPREAYCRAARFVDDLAANALTVTLAVSLGQLRTLVEHPASMTHSALPPEQQLEAGIHPGGIRLSCGIEDVRDIVADLDRSLAKV
jgi:cystathionine beta-lyase/cystathionine gamma-synthase